MPLPPPRLRELDVHIPGLDPRHDGLRIAHLSDIHCGRLTPPRHIRAAIELANAARPDMVALTGDYVCWRRHEVELVREQLGGLTAKHVFAVLGNHDYFTWGRGVIDALQGAGYTVLRNRSVAIEHAGASLHVVGVDDPVTRHHNLDRAFSGVPAGASSIALCHGPDLAPEVAARGAGLVLSGHTHGGQLYLRGVTDRIMKKVGLAYREGLFDVGTAKLYVTPGVGFSGVTRRFGHGTDAEVAVLTLRRAAAVPAQSAA